MKQKKPNFFIVGAPRCGTTAMYHFLNAHPDIFMSEHKEPHYFATDIKPRNPWMKRFRDKDNYLKLFSKVKYEKAVGEASVLYLYSKVAAKNIKKFNPNAKIIIMLRNPVDVSYSLYNQLFFGGDEDVNSFEKALDVEDRRKKGIGFPFGSPRMRELYFYKDVVKFSNQVKRYLEVFPRYQIKFIIYEDFKNNTPKVYKETLKFLGVDLHFNPEFKVINPNVTHKSRFIQLIMTYVAYILNTFGFNLYIHIRPLYKQVERLNLKQVKRPEIDDKLKKKLQKMLINDIKILSKLVNQDLTNWLS